MSLVPSGKFKVMVAQNVANPLVEGFNFGNESNNNLGFLSQYDNLDNNAQPQSQGDLPQTPEATLPPQGLESYPDGMEEQAPQNNVSEVKNNSLTDYVFQKLESFGYPGRRLQEFKTKFVKENISADGIKDIKVEIPDRHYPDEQGGVKTIETDDLGEFVREVETKFQLHFNGAERSDSKWTINFSSIKNSGEEDKEMVRDNLDEVYGNPGARGIKGKKSKPINAFNIRELIKAAKNDELINTLNIIGEKNVT